MYPSYLSNITFTIKLGQESLGQNFHEIKICRLDQRKVPQYNCALNDLSKSDTIPNSPKYQVE